MFPIVLSIIAYVGIYLSYRLFFWPFCQSQYSGYPFEYGQSHINFVVFDVGHMGIRNIGFVSQISLRHIFGLTSLNNGSAGIVKKIIKVK